MDKQKDKLLILPIEKLKAGIYQPRVQFAQESLAELAESIKTTGVLQPILVRPTNAGIYEIIAGERRWRAAQMARLEEVSCIVREYSDKEAARASLMENIHRTDLNAMEQAKMYKKMIEEFNYTHEELGLEIGRPRSIISNTLRLLHLDLRVQDFIMDEKLSGAHGKLLAAVSIDKQYPIAEKSVSQEWSTRQLAREIKKILEPEMMRVTKHKDPNINLLEKLLSDHVGCPVVIDMAGGKGQLKIDFYNLDVLEGLFEKMGFNHEF